MPDLAVALREVVDASADPVTVEEVLCLPVAARPRRRWPLLLAAAGLVLAAGAAGLVLNHDSSAPEISTATTAAGIEVPPLSSCARRVDQPGLGCLVSDAQAAAMLGIPINEPAGIPDGWALAYHHVRYWTDEQPPMADYNRAWFRETPHTTADPCGYGDPACLPDYVQVTVRRAAPSEPFVDRQAGTLHDGTPVFGGSGFIDWQAHGRRYRIRWSGLDLDQALAIADSLA